MSKQHSERHSMQQIPPKPVPVVTAAPKPAPVATPEPVERIESFRRCPLCWERCKGVGLVYSTQGRTRYYKCKRTLTDLPPCGHTWTATVEVVRVEHRVVTLDGER